MAFFHLGDTQKSQGFLGSPVAASCGGSTRAISANDLMWAFFQRHPLP
jgi:poly(3-hydroxybutyrate) depolymerase